MKLTAQMAGETRNSRVELRVSEAALAGEIDGSHLLWRAAAEMGDPVVITNRHNLLLTGGLAPHGGTVERAYRDTVLR
jgi:hypothetical protein